MIDYIQKKFNMFFFCQVWQFIFCLVFCYICFFEEDENGKIDYQVVFFDELVLVRVVVQFGYIVVKRIMEFVIVRMEYGIGVDIEEIYQILDVIEFSSKWKCMLIVFCMLDGRICVFIKGVDSVILFWLKQRIFVMQIVIVVECRVSMCKSVE